MKWFTGLFCNDGTYHQRAHVYNGEPDRCENYCQKCLNEDPDFRLTQELRDLEIKVREQTWREQTKERVEELKRKLK